MLTLITENLKVSEEVFFFPNPLKDNKKKIKNSGTIKFIEVSDIERTPIYNEKTYGKLSIIDMDNFKK